MRWRHHDETCRGARPAFISKYESIRIDRIYHPLFCYTHTTKITPAMDTALQDALPTDIVIPIMGATGAGKSTFIQRLLRHIDDRRTVEVGDHLASCTYDLRSIAISGETHKLGVVFENLTKEHRIVFLDTPSFDNTKAGLDFKALELIANWLQESHRRKMMLGGVVYLHDISQRRFTGTAGRDLEVFKSLCGEAALDKVVLVTTNWDRQVDREFECREEELRNVHWKEMLYPAHGQTGATYTQLDGGNTHGKGASAWAVVAHILRQLDLRLGQESRGEFLRIQEELVREKKSVSQTDAGRELKAQIQKASDTRWQGMLAKIRKVDLSCFEAQG